MSVINYESAEEYIREIESVLDDCDVEEKMIILKFVNQRIQKGLQKQRMSDAMEAAPMHDLVKKFIKSQGGED